MANSNAEDQQLADAGVDSDLIHGKKSKVAMLWLPGKKKRRRRNFVETFNPPPSVASLMGAGSPFDIPQGGLGPVQSILSQEEYGEAPDNLQPADKVMNWIYDDARRAEIEAYLEKKGYHISGWEDLYKYWKLATDQASDAWEISRLRKSPWDILDQMAPYEKKTNIPWKGMGYDQTTQQVDFADMAPETAKGILSNALQNALGRGPTDEEVEDFAARANAIVHENPRISTTQHHFAWDPNKNGPDQGGYNEVGQVTQESGTDSQGITDKVTANAMDTAKESPEYGAYQASTTYMNALMQLIMGGG